MNYAYGTQIAESSESLNNLLRTPSIFRRLEDWSEIEMKDAIKWNR